MILDVILASGAVIAIGIGYSRGFVSSLLALVGYLGGGLGALYLAIHFSHGWKGNLSLIALYIFTILVGAKIGREVFSRFGKAIHKKVFFGPLKFLDSLLGGVLSLAQFVVIAAIVITIIRYIPNQQLDKLTSNSQIYQRFSNLNLLSFQISDLLRSVSSHLDQLKS